MRSSDVLPAVAVLSAAALLVWLRRGRRRPQPAAAAAPSPSGSPAAAAGAGAAAAAGAAPTPVAEAPAATPVVTRASTPHLSRTPSVLCLDSVARFGLDIGGSLTKFIYLESVESQTDEVMARARRARKRAGLEPELEVEVPALGGRLHFAHFETQQVSKTVSMLKRHRLAEGVRRIHATGGGAHKYRRLIESTLGVPLSPCNELDAVVLGICLMAKAVTDECYTYEQVVNPHNMPGGGPAAEAASGGLRRSFTSESLGAAPLRKITKFFEGARDEFFPFLLCNVGTGVSILHVESERSYAEITGLRVSASLADLQRRALATAGTRLRRRYRRVSGSAMGGGTFLGLTRLLTKARKFQEALDVASGGDARRVDMLVGRDHG